MNPLGGRHRGPVDDFVRSVHRVIGALHPTVGRSRIGMTADALDVSVRTLQRRLAEKGLTFETLLRADRLGLAARLLETTDARVLDIALELGYSDHAHFTRAFRRWTGLAPLHYRRARGTADRSLVGGGATMNRGAQSGPSVAVSA